MVPLSAHSRAAVGSPPGRRDAAGHAKPRCHHQPVGNNHRQPNEFYRVLLSRAIDRPRWELFGDEAALILPG